MEELQKMKTILDNYDWTKLDIKDVFCVSSGKAGTKLNDGGNTQIYQIGIKFNGLTEIFYNGEQMNFCGGSVLYLPKEKVSGIDYHKTIIEQGDGVCIFFDSLNPLPEKPILIKCDSSGIEKMFLTLSDVYNRIDSNAFECCAAFYELLSLINKNINDKSNLNKDKTDMVIEYINSHFCDSFIDIGKLADMSGCSMDYFRHKFKRIYGLSPLQYINRLKLKYIKSMICENIYSLTYISEKTGFSDLNYFSRFFKKHTGMSPTEYMRLYGHVS